MVTCEPVRSSVYVNGDRAGVHVLSGALLVQSPALTGPLAGMLVASKLIVLPVRAPAPFTVRKADSGVVLMSWIEPMGAAKRLDTPETAT